MTKDDIPRRTISYTSTTGICIQSQDAGEARRGDSRFRADRVHRPASESDSEITKIDAASSLAICAQN